MKKSFFIFAFSGFCFCANSQSIELERITIEKGLFKTYPQSFDYFSSKDLEDLPKTSLEEVVDYSSSIDLRKRSGFGIQQDISIRGSTFEDGSVNLEGVKINDPQTGHFNLEIPLTSADIKEVAVFRNSQSVNFSLKQPKVKGLLLKTAWGEHALWENLLSVNFPLSDIKNRVSVEHKISSGGRPDTDFEIYNFSFNSLWEKEDRELEFLFASTERDFGADSFYSASFPQEEEHVAQQFFSLSGKLKKDLFDWNNNLYFRRHSDKYILNRHNPSFYTNYHTSYVYGLKTELDFDNNAFVFFDLGREKLDSTNLYKRTRIRKGFSLGIKEKEIEDFVLNLEGGFDYYENYQYLENARLNLGYFLKSNLKLRFSFDKLWRAPSFTELYYNSPANIGNSNLKVQKTNNFELGLDYKPIDNLSLSFNTFLRDQSDTIDWVKSGPADPSWEAENVGGLDVSGFDFYAETTLKDSLLNKVGLGYTYLAFNEKNAYSLSKYVFDYNPHKVVSKLGFEHEGFLANFFVNFSKPLKRKEYTTVDLKVKKKIGNFSLILEGINIFNKDYQEMAEIEGEGRWYKAGIEYSF